MKGLLLKDFYCLWGYMRPFLLICGAFYAGSAFVKGNAFLLYYPSILCGLMSMTLLAYEEKEGWSVYSLALPCPKAMLVSAKYVLCLLLALCCSLLTLISQSICMAIHGFFSLAQLGILVCLSLCLSLVPASLMLPFVYKFGPEKGRLAYYIIMGGFCAIVMMFGSTQELAPALPDSGVITMLAVPVAAVIFAASWWLSIQFYQKREL